MKDGFFSREGIFNDFLVENKKEKSRNIAIYALFVILALTFFSYSRSLNSDFVNYDDNYLLVNNDDIRHFDGEHIAKFLTHQYYGHYYPLTMTIYAAEYQLFGLSSEAFHYTSLFLHLLNVIMVFVLFRKLMKNWYMPIIISALFALHPMQVESVSWLAARSAELYAFFFIGSLISYINYIEKRKAISLLFSILLFILALLSKSSAVVLPIVLFLIDYFSQRKLSVKLILEKVIFLMFSGLWGLLAYLSAKSIGSISYFNAINEGITPVFLVIYSYVFYIVKFFVPIHQSAIHFEPKLTDGMLPLEYYLAPLILIAIVVVFFMAKKNRRPYLFGILLYSILIGLVIRIIPIGSTIVCERYFYMPMIGLGFLIAYLFKVLVETKKETLRRFLPIYTFLIISVIVSFSVITYGRTKVWTNGIELFSDVVEKYPDYGYGYYGRANVNLSLKNIDEAIRDYDIAVAIDSSPYYFFNRGNAYQMKQNFEASIRDYNECLRILPEYREALASRGAAYAQVNDYSNALSDYNKLIERWPSLPENYYNRGLVYSIEGKYEKAIEDYSRSIELDSLNPSSFLNRGNAKLKSGDTTGACEDWVLAYSKGETKAGAPYNKYCVKKDVQETIVNKDSTLSPKDIKDNNVVVFTDKGTGERNRIEIVTEIIQGKEVEKLKRYNDSGVLTEEGVINKEGKYDGEVNWYYLSGKMKIKGYYSGEKPYGDWTEYYESGQVMATYTYLKGLRAGSYKYFHENGKLWTERMYKDDKLWKVLSNFDKNGNPLDPGTLNEGNGYINVYDENGNLTSQIHYSNGLKVK